MRLEFHPEAELELIEAGLYYELEVPGLGARFETEVKQATELLLEQPELGHASTGDLRQLVLYRFPFTIIYAASHDLLFVVALAHHKRLPGYWRSRV